VYHFKLRLSKILSIISLLLVSSICFAQTVVMAAKIDDLITLDPAQLLEIFSGEYSGNVYQTLVRNDESGTDASIKPEVAESWTIGEDGRTYTFKIKRYLKFATGNTLSAHDVEYSFKRALKMRKSPITMFLDLGLTVNSIKVLNDYTFQIVTNPDLAPTFVLNVLSSPLGSIVDKKLVMQHEVNGDFGANWLNQHSAGSGAFILNEWKPNEHLKLSKNPFYEPKVSFDRLIIKHIPESSTQKLMVLRGDVDIARNIIDLEGVPENAYVVKRPSSPLVYLGLNQENPILANPKVRQALKYLIDYRAIESSIMKHLGKVHQSFIPEKFLGFDNKEPFSLNLTKAKKLLEEAGFKDGFSVNLDAENIELAQAIQGYFSLAKIKVKIIPGDSKQILTKYRKRAHDMVLATWAADYIDPHGLAYTFVSNGPDSVGVSVAWRNSWIIPELTKKTMQAVREKDTFSRIKIYNQIQEEFYETSPFIMLFQKISVVVINNNVSGFALGVAAFNTKYEKIVKKTS
jgi:peptide/nickel transport system substrate-binding protein